MTDKLYKLALRGTRSLLVMNIENLKQNEKVDDQNQLREALKLKELLAIANDLKEDLRQLWH